MRCVHAFQTEDGTLIEVDEDEMPTDSDDESSEEERRGASSKRRPSRVEPQQAQQCIARAASPAPAAMVAGAQSDSEVGLWLLLCCCFDQSVALLF